MYTAENLTDVVFVFGKVLNDNFSADNWNISSLGASIIREGNKTLLRLIFAEDMQNDIVKCLDASYTADG